jgi:hypothetical protein
MERSSGGENEFDVVQDDALGTHIAYNVLSPVMTVHPPGSKPKESLPSDLGFQPRSRYPGRVHCWLVGTVIQVPSKIGPLLVSVHCPPFASNPRVCWTIGGSATAPLTTFTRIRLGGTLPTPWVSTNANASTDPTVNFNSMSDAFCSSNNDALTPVRSRPSTVHPMSLVESPVSNANSHQGGPVREPVEIIRIVSCSPCWSEIVKAEPRLVEKVQSAKFTLNVID